MRTAIAFVFALAGAASVEAQDYQLPGPQLPSSVSKPIDTSPAQATQTALPPSNSTATARPPAQSATLPPASAQQK